MSDAAQAVNLAMSNAIRYLAQDPTRPPEEALARSVWGREFLKLDLKKAFNLASRKAALAEVWKEFPEIYPWVYTIYGGEPPVLFWGQYGLASYSGSQQGDPLAGLLFCLVLRLLLLKVMAKCPDLDVSAWYCDDGGMVGRRSELVTAWKVISVEGPPLGLYVKGAGCLRFWPGGSGGIPDQGVLPPGELDVEQEEAWRTIPVSTEGCDMLGAPLQVSGTGFVVENLKAKSFAPLAEGLRTLVDVMEGQPQVQLTILRLSLGLPKIRHIFATISPDVYWPLLEQADRDVERATSSILDNPRPTEFTRRMWTLPQGLAGLGVGSARVEAAPAFVATVNKTSHTRSLIHEKSASSVQGIKPAWNRLAQGLPARELDVTEDGRHKKVDVGRILQSKSARSKLSNLSYQKQYAMLFKAGDTRQRAVMITGREDGARTAVTLSPRESEGTALPKESFRRLAAVCSVAPLFPMREGPPMCAFCARA